MNNRTVYIASCTENGGIYQCNLSEDGKLTVVSFTHMDSPMYMIINNSKMTVLLRAPFENGESGVVTYDIAPDGSLENPSGIITTKGEVACHLCADGDDIYCVNYISGNVTKIGEKTVTHTGSGPDPDRQEGPHTHFVGLTPDKKYLLVTDLGLDTIFVYDKDLNVVSQAKVPDGHGARHLIFSDCGKYMFVANEMKSTVSAFSYSDGCFDLIDTKSCLPDDFAEKSIVSAIRYHKGRIYVSNRGHESVAQMEFDGKALKLTDIIPVFGTHPRDFDFAEDLIISTNMTSNNVAVINPLNKTLISELKLEQPLCIVVSNLQTDKA